MDKNNPSVLSKLDNQKIGDIFYNKTSDILNFISLPHDFRGQNVLFNLRLVLENNSQEIVRLLTHEIGKPITQCQEELDNCIDILNSMEKIELSPQSTTNILILGSVAAPIYELTYNVAKYVHSYSKIIYKPSTKAAITLNFIFQKMSEEIGITDRIFIAPMTKHVLDDILNKIYFTKIINYSRAKILNKKTKIEELSKLDRVLLIDNNSDLDYGVNIIVENLFGFNSFNTSRIQHLFISKDCASQFANKLISKIELGITSGRADDENVNFSDNFKSYKRQSFKELILELVSLGAELIYGTVEDVITSPIIIKCDNSMEKYYLKNLWAPIIFLIEYEGENELKMFSNPFLHTHEFISLISEEHFSHTNKLHIL